MTRADDADKAGGPTITTLLLPGERAGVDAAVRGHYQALHRESLEEAVRDLRERRAGAVLLSVARCAAAETSRVAAVVREYPQSPAVELLASREATTAQTVLALERNGVRTLIDVRSPIGWRDLR